MSLPEIFTNRIKELVGEQFPAFLEALEQTPPVSIRLNPKKTENNPPDTSGLTPILWATDAFYLPERPSFTLDPLFHAGCYYVQEASSMFLEQFIRTYINQPICCLDLCAAPGGKSTQLSSLLPPDSLLISNEVIRSRAHILAENLSKWGNPDTIVINNDPADIGKLESLFDLIVADVPCSGEGMFRKDPQSRGEWSENNVKLCKERQQRIISDVWPALKPGGILIYSTCTYNTEENEENIQWIINELGATALNMEIPASWNISGSKKGEIPVYRFFPHLTRGEGFFIAALQKREGFDNEIAGRDRKEEKKNKIKPSSGSGIPAIAHSWIKDPDLFDFSIRNNKIRAVSKKHKDVFSLVEQSLHILSAGISIGEMKGKDLIPNHGLAMSHQLNIDIFPQVRIDKETALSFLRKEAIHNLPENTPNGFVLLTYQGKALGFVKNIGTRSNNLYPTEWRIRH